MVHRDSRPQIGLRVDNESKKVSHRDRIPPVDPGVTPGGTPTTGLEPATSPLRKGVSYPLDHVRQGLQKSLRASHRLINKRGKGGEGKEEERRKKEGEGGCRVGLTTKNDSPVILCQLSYVSITIYLLREEKVFFVCPGEVWGAPMWSGVPIRTRKAIAARYCIYLHLHTITILVVKDAHDPPHHRDERWRPPSPVHPPIPAPARRDHQFGSPQPNLRITGM